MRKQVPVDPITMDQMASPLRGKVGHPPRLPTHLDGGHRARRSGSQSMAERTSPRSSWQRMSSPHVSPSNVPSRHEPTPSTLRTTRRGIATAEPATDERRSCGRLTPCTPFHYRRHKNLVHYGNLTDRRHSVKVRSDPKAKYNSQRTHVHQIVHLLHYPPSPAQTCSKQGVNALKPLTTLQVNPMQ